MSATDRIAAIIADHVYYEWAVGPDDYCICRASVTDSGYPVHVAEQVATTDGLAVLEIPTFPDVDPYIGAELGTVQVLRQDDDEPWQVYPCLGRLYGPYTPEHANEIGGQWLAAARAAEAASKR